MQQWIHEHYSLLLYSTLPLFFYIDIRNIFSYTGDGMAFDREPQHQRCNEFAK